ncbi:MAG: hypothetical protein ACLVJ6_14550 [Merdibacter sp.]
MAEGTRAVMADAHEPIERGVRRFVLPRLCLRAGRMVVSVLSSDHPASKQRAFHRKNFRPQAFATAKRLKEHRQKWYDKNKEVQGIFFKHIMEVTE